MLSCDRSNFWQATLISSQFNCQQSASQFLRHRTVPLI
jgi:hypothetical protein